MEFAEPREIRTHKAAMKEWEFSLAQKENERLERLEAEEIRKFELMGLNLELRFSKQRNQLLQGGGVVVDEGVVDLAEGQMVLGMRAGSRG